MRSRTVFQSIFFVLPLVPGTAVLAITGGNIMSSMKSGEEPQAQPLTTSQCPQASISKAIPAVRMDKPEGFVAVLEDEGLAEAAAAAVVQATFTDPGKTTPRAPSSNSAANSKYRLASCAMITQYSETSLPPAGRSSSTAAW